MRLRLLRRPAAADDIVPLFGDKSEALTPPYLAHAWAKRDANLRVPAPCQVRKRAQLGVFNYGSGELIVRVSASKQSTDLIVLLEKLNMR